MLTAHLSGRAQHRSIQGAKSAIYAISSSLRTDLNADDVAIYQGGVWHSLNSDESYERVIIEQPCRVRFVNNAADEIGGVASGPYPVLIIARGVIKTSGSRPRIVALFDDALEQWRSFEDDSVWPVLVIEDAVEATTSAA